MKDPHKNLPTLAAASAFLATAMVTGAAFEHGRSIHHIDAETKARSALKETYGASVKLNSHVEQTNRNLVLADLEVPPATAEAWGERNDLCQDARVDLGNALANHNASTADLNQKTNDMRDACTINGLVP